MQGLGTILLTLILCTFVGNAMSCTRDEECMYGGVCDQALKACTCNLACSRYETSRLVCSTLIKFPQSECFFLTRACEIQENVPITVFKPAVFVSVGSCKKFEFSIHEEFCENQSFCHGNGICMKKKGTDQPFCRCASHYSGDRCDTKGPVVNAVEKNVEVPNREHSGGIGPAPLAGIVVASFAVTTLVVFILGKRFYRPSNSNDDATPGADDRETEENGKTNGNPRSELSTISSVKSGDGSALKQVVVTNCVMPIADGFKEGGIPANTR